MVCMSRVIYLLANRTSCPSMHAMGGFSHHSALGLSQSVRVYGVIGVSKFRSLKHSLLQDLRYDLSDNCRLEG
jgi:hypothetical protein